MSKKVLILAYNFPPFPAVSGLRPFGWYQDMKALGFGPVVVTRQWSKDDLTDLAYIKPGYSDEVDIQHSATGTIVAAPYKPNFSNRLLLKHGPNKYRMMRKVNSGLVEMLQYIWPVGPKRTLYKAARAYMQNNKVDVIIATGDPFVLFKYAHQLSKEFGIPWVADYRDLWSQDTGMQNQGMVRKWMQKQEQKLGKKTALITTVSPFLKSNLEDFFDADKIEVHPNGYNEQNIQAVASVSPTGKRLKIGFIGSIYEWNPIMDTLDTLAETRKLGVNLEINLYGINKQYEIEAHLNAHHPDWKSWVSISPRLANDEALKVLAAHHVLLLFNHYSIIGTKIFDYIGLKRKILLCFTNDEKAMALKAEHFHFRKFSDEAERAQQNVLEETESAVCVENHVHLKQVLQELAETLENTGEITVPDAATEAYSRTTQTKKLITSLRKIVEHG